jgi:hypothetical protein
MRFAKNLFGQNSKQIKLLIIKPSSLCDRAASLGVFPSKAIELALNLSQGLVHFG